MDFSLSLHTVNFRLVVQKRDIEFQIDQSHSAKLFDLPNTIGQFTFQYCVLVDNRLEIYDIYIYIYIYIYIFFFL